MTLVGKPIFVVGKLTIRGDRFAFAPAAAKPLAVKAGQEFEVALTYEYEEASAERETAVIRFAASLQGLTLGSKEASIEDRPVVKDMERGTLALTAKLAKAGEVEGAFTVEAGYAAEPWGGGEAATKGRAFHHQGKFRVKAG